MNRPPTSLQHAREVVGPTDAREDVSLFTDRAILVRALDVALRTHEEVRAIRLGVRLELDDVQVRLEAVETTRSGTTPDPFPAPWKKGAVERDRDSEPEAGSYNEIQQLFGNAGAEVYKRMKDPQSNFDSERARAIAHDVIQQTRKDEELHMWRRIKSLAPTVGMATLKALGPFIAGGLVWELLHILAKVR